MIAMKITVVCALFCAFFLDGACSARLKRQAQTLEEKSSSQDILPNDDPLMISEEVSKVSNEDMNVEVYDSFLKYLDKSLQDTLSSFEVSNQASAAPVASSGVESSIESSTGDKDTSYESLVDISASKTKSSPKEVFSSKEADDWLDATKSASSKEDKDPSSNFYENNESVSSDDEESSVDSSSSKSTSINSKDRSSSESSSSKSKDSVSSESTNSKNEDSSSSESTSSNSKDSSSDSSSSESTSSNSKDSSSDSSSSESTSSNSKDSSASKSTSSNDKNLSTDSSESASSSSESSDDSSIEEEEKSIDKDVSDDKPTKETHLNPKVQGMNIALYYILQNLNRRMLFDQEINFEPLVKVLALTYKIEKAGGTVIDFNQVMLKNIIEAYPTAFREALTSNLEQ